MAKKFKIKRTAGTNKIGKDDNNKGKMLSELDIDPEGGDCNCNNNLVLNGNHYCKILYRPIEYRELLDNMDQNPDNRYWPGTNPNPLPPIIDYATGEVFAQSQFYWICRLMNRNQWNYDQPFDPCCGCDFYVKAYNCVDGKLSFAKYERMQCGSFIPVEYGGPGCDVEFNSYPTTPIPFMEEIP